MTSSPLYRRALLRAASALALVALAGGAASAQTVSISADPTVDEGASTVITVTRTEPTTSAVTVTIGFGSASTAGAGEVALGATTLTIPAGQTTATTTLTASEDDDLVDETAVVEIKSATGAAVGARSVSVRIRDNDAPRVRLEVSPAPPTTINEGSTATLTVRLTRAASAPVEVRLASTGDADAFSLTPSTVTVPQGQTSATATLLAVQDADTADETVVVSVDEVTGGGAVEDGEQSQTVTIRDDDGGDEPRVTVSASPTQIAEDGGVSTITVQLSRRASAATTVSLSVGAGDDGVTLSAGSVTIPADQTRGTVTLTARNDADFADEQITVTVTGVSGSNARVVGDQTATVTVTDDDLAPVTLTASRTSIAEGEVSLLTVALPAGATANDPITVRLAYAVEDNDGDDTDGADRSDFTAPTQIVIPAGQNAATDTLEAVQDPIFEADTEVTVSIDRVTGRGVESGEQAVTVTITDDDSRPTVTFRAMPRVIGARGGRSELTATLSNPTDEVVAVGLTYVGSAVRGTNYTAPDTVFVQPGSLTGSAPLVGLRGGDGQQVLIDVGGIRNATESGTQQELVSFRESLNRTTVAFADAQATVAEGAGTYALRLTVSEALATPATVTLSLTGGAAEDLGGFTTRAVSIPAGATAVTVPITVTDDALREGDEAFTFALSTTDTDRLRVGEGTFTLTVTDDDDETAFVVNEVDGIVGRRSAQFVELFAAGGGRADGLSLVVYAADSTVATVVDLDSLAADAGGYLVVCDTAADDPACDVEVEGFPLVLGGAAIVRGDGPDVGDDFDEDDDELVDSVFIDERAAAEERAATDNSGVEAEDGSLQRRADGRFAFVAPPTPGAANREGIAVPTTPAPVAGQAVGDVFPNPSLGRAAVEVSVAEAQHVRVSVYDALGREVAVAFDGAVRPGTAVRVALGGAGFAPGVYIVRVAGETFVEARRLTVAR